MGEVEEWRPAPGVPHYRVSSLGRIWSEGNTRRPPGIVRGAITANGYLAVKTYRHGNKLAHRLICEAFHGPAPEGMRLVRHLDGDKPNNRADNLAWGTDLDNHLDAVGHGYIPHPPVRRRFSDDDVRRIRAACAAGETQMSVASRYGVTFQSIGAIVRRQRYQHVDSDTS